MSGQRRQARPVSVPEGASRQVRRQAERAHEKALDKQRKLQRPLTPQQQLDAAYSTGTTLVQISANVDAPVCLTYTKNGGKDEEGLVLATSDPAMVKHLLTSVEVALEHEGKLTVWPPRSDMSNRLAASLAQEERVGGGILQPGDPGFAVPGGVL